MYPFSRFIFKKINILIVLFSICFLSNSKAQCFMPVPSCGYAISIDYTVLSINLGAGYPPCTWGYMYTVTYAYTITVTGVNTCYNQSIDVLPNVLCGAITSWPPANIVVPGPVVGNSAITSTYTGQIITSGQWNPLNNCLTATPTSLNCQTTNIYFGGPGLPWTLFICDDVGLPVDLIAFEATCIGVNDVNIHWECASQKNNDFFTIERSINGTDWEEIERVSGAGNTTELISYNVIDKKNNDEITYYRLKQTDFDGTFDYFTSIIVGNCFEKPSHIIISPNPTNGLFILESKYDEKVEVFDVLGNLVFTQNLMKGKNTIDLSNYSDGIYMLYISNEETLSTTKIIKGL